MSPGFSLIQVIHGASNYNIDTVFNKMIDEFLKVHHLWTPFNKRKIDDTKRSLHLGVLIQLIKYNSGICRTLQNNYDPDSFTVRLIAYFWDLSDLFIVNESGDLLDQRTFINLVRYFSNNDLFTVSTKFLSVSAGPKGHFTTTCFVSLFYSFIPVNDTGSRKIRSCDMLHQFLDLNIRIIDISLNAIDHFRHIMWSHICGHTNSNTWSTIDQKVGKHTWKNGWFFKGIVKVRREVYCLLIDVSQHFFW